MHRHVHMHIKHMLSICTHICAFKHPHVHAPDAEACYDLIASFFNNRVLRGADTYIHTYAYTHLGIRIHAYVHTCINTLHRYIHTYIHTHAHSHLRKHIHIHAYTHTHTYSRTQIHTHIYMRTYIRRYMHTCVHMHTYKYAHHMCRGMPRPNCVILQQHRALGPCGGRTRDQGQVRE